MPFKLSLSCTNAQLCCSCFYTEMQHLKTHQSIKSRETNILSFNSDSLLCFVLNFTKQKIITKCAMFRSNNMWNCCLKRKTFMVKLHLATTWKFEELLILWWLLRYRNWCLSYTTVAILIEDLWRQWIAFLWFLFLGDVAVHPEPLLLQHGNVDFLEVNSICLQETHNCLLMFLYLDRSKEGG